MIIKYFKFQTNVRFSSSRNKHRFMYTYRSVIQTPADKAFVDRCVAEFLNPKKHFSYRPTNLSDVSHVATRDVVVYRRPEVSSSDVDFSIFSDFFATSEGLGLLAASILLCAITQNREMITEFVLKIFGDFAPAMYAALWAFAQTVIDTLTIHIRAYFDFFFNNVPPVVDTILKYATEVYKNTVSWLLKNIPKADKDAAAKAIADAMWEKFSESCSGWITQAYKGLVEQPIRAFNSIPPEFYERSKDAFYSSIDAVPPIPMVLHSIPITITK
jgi:hypothetical protein